ncbi:hypothetical protein AD935_11160 [Gluconobacter japonicus]|nr:hypothetical protein AD935_11160 [Gluconobacter japonicus]
MECHQRYGSNSRTHLLQEGMCNSALPRITAYENNLAEAEFHDPPWFLNLWAEVRRITNIGYNIF